MARSETMVFEHGNFEVKMTCAIGDVSEELSSAPEPDKQIVPLGVRSLRYKTNVGDTGASKWKDIPKSIDYSEIVEMLDAKDKKIRQLTAERNALQKRVEGYEQLGTVEEVQDAVSNSV